MVYGLNYLTGIFGTEAHEVMRNVSPGIDDLTAASYIDPSWTPLEKFANFDHVVNYQEWIVLRHWMNPR